MDIETIPTGEKREWAVALRAVRKLLADPQATEQVFVIMRALNASDGPRNSQKLMRTPDGPRMAYHHVELASERFSDPAWLAQFAPGTVGAAYRGFLEATGFSATGLADISNLEQGELIQPHPYAWLGRRTRDVHDIWHVLTGYSANEPGGEAGLVAFSYAQTGGLGWAAIAVAAALRGLSAFRSLAVPAMIWEGYRNGRHAAWLLGEDYEALFAEPLEAARARLRVRTPKRYLALRERMATFLAPPEAMAVAAE